MTATSATLSFSQPTNSLSVDMYTVTLTSTTCNGVPMRTGSTTSNSVTIGSLKAGVRYSVAAVGRNNLAELEGTGSAALTTSEAGNNIQRNCSLNKQVIYRIDPIINLVIWYNYHIDTVPSGSPGAPTFSAATSTNITITWTEIACLSRNGVITGYTIRYGPVNTLPTTIDHTSTDRSRVISGLTPFTNYTVSVRGVNIAGGGGYSREAVIRTDEAGECLKFIGCN